VQNRHKKCVMVAIRETFSLLGVDLLSALFYEAIDQLNSNRDDIIAAIWTYSLDILKSGLDFANKYI